MRADSKVIPQKKSAPLSPGIFVGIVLGATTVGVGAMVYFFNPSTHGFYPICLFHSMTGLNCPGCGMTRALYALLHGNLRLALKDNLLFVLLLATMVIWGVRFAVLKMRNRPVAFKVPSKLLWMLLVVGIIFAVVRNMPGFEWLSP